MIALVARYHRRAPACEIARRHGRPAAAAATRPCASLAAFLRLAETLDRSQHGVVRKVEVRERAGNLRLDVFAVGDSELEVWAASRQLMALEQALKRPVKIVAHKAEDTGEPARPRARKKRAA